MSAVVIKTPIGSVGIEEQDGQIVHLYFPNESMPVPSEVIPSVLKKAVRQLQEYFLPAEKDLVPDAGVSAAEMVDSAVTDSEAGSDVDSNDVDSASGAFASAGSRKSGRKSKVKARRSFDLPLLMRGTDFQKAVWREMLKIPYGETISYQELARRAGREKAVRAAASACAKNGIGIFIPCHRVIGSNGRLTGFGGGLDVKKFLLNMEKNAVR